MQRVLIDASWSGETGIGKVFLELKNRSHLSKKEIHFNWKKRNPFYSILISINLHIQQKDIGAFWSPGFFPPAFCKTPTVITVHDLTHLHYYSSAHRLYYNIFLKYIYRKVNLIITVSDFTRQELLEWAGLDPDRIVTIHNAVGPEFCITGEKIDLGYPFLFYPGNRRSYKNLDRLIEAYARSTAPMAGIRLLLTGKPDDHIAELAQRFGVTGNVICAGFIPDEQMPVYYRSAHAVTFVSLYEGFGLPILEGMASGVPVLTSDVSAMPEVAGGAAYLVDPTSSEAIAEGINRIAFDETLRKQLIAAGLQRVKDFSWDRSAEKLWGLVERVGKGEFAL